MTTRAISELNAAEEDSDPLEKDNEEGAGIADDTKPEPEIIAPDDDDTDEDDSTGASDPLAEDRLKEASDDAADTATDEPDEDVAAKTNDSLPAEDACAASGSTASDISGSPCTTGS